MAVLFATPAAACGSAMLLALMFTAFPEAEGVLWAEKADADAGLLQGDQWTPQTGLETGLAIHEWRTEKTAVTVNAIETRLGDLPVQPHLENSAHILLIHEFRWLEVTSQSDGARANLRGLSSEGDGPRFFTTRYVLDNLLAGTLTWDDAIGRGLIRSPAPLEEQSPWLAVLHNALATPHKS
ncbi:MAG: hypothetical protein ACFB0Z_12600 [Candidatus Phaeomarinobacter sp.]